MEAPAPPEPAQTNTPVIPEPAAKSAAVWNGNWLVITVDTLRADRIHPKTTPTLAKLAAEGFQFGNAYAQAPNTPRSFPSFLTGRLPSDVHFVKQSLNFSPLTGKDPTLFTESSRRAAYGGNFFTSIWIGKPGSTWALMNTKRRSDEPVRLKQRHSGTANHGAGGGKNQSDRQRVQAGS